MIRTGEEYRAGLRDGREVWIDGERVQDVTAHPAFKPVVDLKARMYDMAHETAWAELMSYRDDGERCSILLRPPTEKAHWHEKWRAVDAYLNDIRGILTRVGDETVGEMWSLLDGREVLNEIDPRFGDNIDRHIRRVLQQDTFHVSANTDPKGDRSKRPQDQDPDMMVHVLKETDAGIVLRGAKYETAASYADQAFLKPTVGPWTDEELSDYAVGCIVKMGAPGVKHLCRSGFAGRTGAADYPLANRFDEIDTLVVLDDVPVPWEDVFFYRHTRAANYIRGTLHRYSAFPYVLRILYMADLMIGTAEWNVKQTGLDKLPAVREKLADLVCYREGINAHLIAAIAEAQRSPSGLLMPHQSLLYAGRVHACSNLPQMMHIARELCGGQICVTPNAASFAAPGARMARKILHAQRQLAGRGPPQIAGLRPRPPKFGLRRASADLCPVRPGAALQSFERGLQRLRFFWPARIRQESGGPIRSG